MPPLIRLPGNEVSLDALRGATVCVMGYGAQGHAHALNLRDSGVHVVVAQRSGSRRYEAAVAAGFDVRPVERCVSDAALLIFALPDESMPQIFETSIRPALRAGQALGFIHGFNITYQLILPPPDVDVVLVAPKAQGHAVRREFEAGRGAAALMAVHQDVTGNARRIALAWASGIGSARSAVFETTFRDETETDLFGEQAVLCGGLSELIRAAYDTLVEAGYPPEAAYFECCHEVKLVADLIYQYGIAGMRERISNTARYGDLTRGPRIIDDHVRRNMREVLAEIRSGKFAEEWMRESRAGLPEFRRLSERDQNHSIETVGSAVRDILRPESA